MLISILNSVTVKYAYTIPRKDKCIEISMGLFQCKRLPFGLCNATATFQRLMSQALTKGSKTYGNWIMRYVEDVVTATPTLENHMEHLNEVFAIMKRVGLKFKPSS